MRFGDLDSNSRRSDGNRACCDERESGSEYQRKPGFDYEREPALAYEREPELE